MDISDSFLYSTMFLFALNHCRATNELHHMVSHILFSLFGLSQFSLTFNLRSDLVLTTGSDRSIQVFDVNKSTQCRIVEDCHTKPAHHITQNKVTYDPVQQ